MLLILTLLWTSSFPAQQALDENMDLLEGITGFEDSVRKCKFLSELGLPEGREWQQVLRVALRLSP